MDGAVSSYVEALVQNYFWGKEGEREHKLGTSLI